MEELWSGDPFGESIGMKLLSIEGGRARVSLEIEAHHLNALHVVHGGVPYSLIDHAMGMALFSTLKEGERCATLEIKIHYVNAVRRGTLIAEGEVVDRKRRFALLEGEVRCGELLVAKAIGSFYISPLRIDTP